MDLYLGSTLKQAHKKREIVVLGKEESLAQEKIQCTTSKGLWRLFNLCFHNSHMWMITTSAAESGEDSVLACVAAPRENSLG